MRIGLHVFGNFSCKQNVSFYGPRTFKKEKRSGYHEKYFPHGKVWNEPLDDHWTKIHFYETKIYFWVCSYWFSIFNIFNVLNVGICLFYFCSVIRLETCCDSLTEFSRFFNLITDHTSNYDHKYSLKLISERNYEVQPSGTLRSNGFSCLMWFKLERDCIDRLFLARVYCNSKIFCSKKCLIS